jgi:hypothetical protein
MSTLSFILRFYQKYTSWTLLRLAFLAEARTDIEADYYIIGIDGPIETPENLGRKILQRL